MLPRCARLTRREDFRTATRRGRRSARSTVVAHLAPRSDEDAAGSPRVGFVVGRAVGGSVVRHRVQRRLRHIVRDRLHRLPPGSLLVLRALPAAADADSARLAGDVDRALDGVLARAGARR